MQDFSTENPGTTSAGALTPRNLQDIETLVLATLGEVLQTSPLRPDQDFLDLGGNSLTAAQAIARIQDAVGVQLPLEAFFEAATLEEIVNWVHDLTVGD